MINLRNSPFLWMAIWLLLSYVIGQQIRIEAAVLVPACAAGLVISTVFAWKSYSPTCYYWSSVAISLAICFAGCWHQFNFEQTHFPTPLLDQAHEVNGVLEIAQVLKVKENRITLRCINRGITSNDDSTVVNLGDRFILLQVREPDSTILLPGDVLEVKGRLLPISKPLNPKSFDARKYYLTLGIRHQLSCQATEVIKYSSTRFSFQRMSARWQSYLSSTVRNHTSPASAQVINALVWGDRVDMDEAVRDAFADSGAMHVLSVSGMHVAMIYSLLMLILGAPGEGTFARRLIRFILYAGAILLYVGLTGACPAVVRAGLMILLYLFGKSMGWNTQVWNLIGFAAFMMLWINPLVYHNIGFQLSFLAMAGILLYAKPIIHSLAFKYKLMHWSWEIIALSLAAQIFILPVILSQFHQFPLTFIISSMVAIPAGYIVIFGAISNVILSVMGMDALWPLLDYACVWFVDCMKWMAKLNPSMQYALPPLTAAMLMMVAVVYSFALIYRWPKGKQIAYALCFGIIIALGWHRWKSWHTDEVIVYHNYAGAVIDVFRDGYGYSFFENGTLPTQLEFPTRGYRCHKDVMATKPITFDKMFSGGGIEYNDRQIRIASMSMVLYGNDWLPQDPAPLHTHILLLSCQDTIQFRNFLDNYPGAKVIIDGSCPRWQADRAVKVLNARRRDYHNITTQGYYRIRL